MKDASIYQRLGMSPKWWISYWCATRMKRVHEPTHWRVDDPTGKKHAIRYAAAKSAEAAAFRGVSKLEVWSSWVDKFLAEHYRGRTGTLTRYRNAWDWLRVYLDELGLVHPAAVNYTHVLNYLAWRAQTKRNCGKPVSRNTALYEIKVFTLIMREAQRREFCTNNPCERLGISRDPAKEKAEITDSEIQLIRRLISEKEAHLPLPQRWMTIAFTIALYHGCRLSETQIPMTAIDFRSNELRISGKGRNGVRKVFTNRIHPSLLPLLIDLRDAGAGITCTLPRMASKDWHLFFKAVPELSHLCFHCTRVTVVTRLARAGVPIQQAMRYVGHASQTVHRVYQRLKSEDLTLCTQALSYADSNDSPQIQGASVANP